MRTSVYGAQWDQTICFLVALSMDPSRLCLSNGIALKLREVSKSCFELAASF